MMKMPLLSPPSAPDLLDVLRSDEIHNGQKEFDVVDTNRFTVEQVAIALSAWGRKKKKSLQLGCFVDSLDPQLYPVQSTDEDCGSCHRVDSQ